MLTLTLQIDGHTESDLEIALEEIKRLTSQGFRSGFNQNSTGRFNFSIDGSPVDYYKIRRNGKTLDEKFSSYDELYHTPKIKPQDEILMFDDSNYELGMLK